VFRFVVHTGDIKVSLMNVSFVCMHAYSHEYASNTAHTLYVSCPTSGNHQVCLKFTTILSLTASCCYSLLCTTAKSFPSPPPHDADDGLLCWSALDSSRHSYLDDHGKPISGNSRCCLCFNHLLGPQHLLWKIRCGTAALYRAYSEQSSLYWCAHWIARIRARASAYQEASQTTGWCSCTGVCVCLCVCVCVCMYAVTLC
jgi:hypothetical protein